MSKAIRKFERDMLHGSDIYISRKTDGVWVKKHWHNYYEIIYFEKADGHCTLNGERYEISAGSLFLLTPMDFHEIVTDEKRETDALIIAFNEGIADGSVIDAINKGPVAVKEITEGLSVKFSELYGLFESVGEYREKRLYHLFNCILFEILEGSRTLVSGGSDISPIVRESISLMLSDPSAPLSLEFFGKRFNLTTSYFSRLFHKHAGVPFKQYLTELRLEYAKQLLKEKNIPIIDVGYECGFNTPSQFYREFKKAFGITPSGYRHAQKNG